MTSPDKKKRKHSKKTKRSSRTPSRSVSYSSHDSYDRHQSSHYKRRKGKKHSSSQAYSPSRERSRSHGKGKKHRRSPQRGDSKDRKVSPPPFPQMWPGSDPAGAASMFSGMGFPAFFQQKIPIQLPTIPSNYKPTKASRTIKNPKTQFKGRLYIPYTYDIAMVTIHDKYLTKDIPQEIITGLAKRVVQQTEKRAKDQKQDEVVLRRIQLLNEDVIQSFKLLQNKKKKKTPEKQEQLSTDESILLLSETASMNDFLALRQDSLDQEITDLISKIGIKYDKSNQMEFEPRHTVLLKEAKDLFQQIS